MARMGVWSAAAVVFVALLAGEVLGGSFSSRNSTEGGSEVNTGAFRALMEGKGSRMDAVEECIEHVRLMKQKYVNNDIFSFPPADFVPEGTREWCECIVANPPQLGRFRPISEYDDDYIVEEVPAGLRRRYNASFNKCRADVLEGSNINTVDMCRGMFSLFGRQLNTLQVSFCGELCAEGTRPGVPYYFSGPEFRFDHNCADPCAREAMPGYCNSTPLEYTNVISSHSIHGSTTRGINVAGRTIVRQQMSGRPVSKVGVDAVCTALAPSLGGNKNECCNYPKAFSLFRDCCSVNEDRLAEFNCNRIYQDEFEHLCKVVHNPYSYRFTSYFQSECDEIIEEYLRNFQGTAKAFGNTVMFPERMLKNICGGGETCCGITDIPFVANCVPAAERLAYAGAVEVERLAALDEPTPAAPLEEEEPCHDLCGEGRDCVVPPSGPAFCVECSAMVRETNSGTDVECCKYDSEKMKCVSARKGLTPGHCKRGVHDLFFVNDEGDREEATLLSDRGFACSNPREFRKNGAACLVYVNANGKARCYE